MKKFNTLCAIAIAGIVALTGGVVASTSTQASADEKIVAWSWGESSIPGTSDLALGQGGKYSGNQKYTPKEVVMPADTTFVETATGDGFSIALDTNGDLWSWGSNASGQLGNGNYINSNIPVKVLTDPGISFVSIAAQNQRAFAVGTNGKVYAWGSNYSSYELGLGAEASKRFSTPQEITFPEEVIVTKVFAHSNGLIASALTSTGDVFSWGTNSWGGLGVGDEKSYYTPQKMLISDVTYIANNWHNTYALSGNKVFYMNPKTPQLVHDFGSEEIIQIDYTRGVNFALTSEGTLYSWGKNSEGLLGHGEVNNITAPTAVIIPGVSSISKIITSTVSVFVLTDEGLIYSWGSNHWGELGNGSTTSTKVPTKVFSPEGQYFTSISAGSYPTVNASGLNTTVVALGNIVKYPPEITIASQQSVVRVGNEITITSDVRGYPDPTVQWQVSNDGGATWSNISGQNGANYKFKADENTDKRTYRAVATNSEGTANSNELTFGLELPPTITDPANQTVNEGESATFTVTAAGSPAPTLIGWRCSGLGLMTEGVSEDGLSLTLEGSLDNQNRSCEAFAENSVGRVWSKSATLTVIPAIAPTITNPANQEAVVGGTVDFTIEAFGLPNPTVEWEFLCGVDDLGEQVWINISSTECEHRELQGAVVSADGKTLTISASLNNHGIEVRATASNFKDTATSLSAIYIVLPTITNPADQIVDEDEYAIFTATATGAPEHSDVFWQRWNDDTEEWVVLTEADAEISYETVADTIVTTIKLYGDLSADGTRIRARSTNGEILGSDALRTAVSTEATLSVRAFTPEPLDIPVTGSSQLPLMWGIGLAFILVGIARGIWGRRNDIKEKTITK